MTINRHPWRRVGAVLECRLDVHFAPRRVVRAAPEEARIMSAEEAVRLFAQPDLPADAVEVASALLSGSFEE